MNHTNPKAGAAANNPKAGDIGKTSKPRGIVTVPAVLKSVAIIRFLNERGGRGAALPDFAAQLSITRSHCHNILRTLVHAGWLSYDASTRMYFLDSTLFADVSTALVSKQYVGAIQPFVQRLADATGFPCMVSEPIADGSFLVVLTANTADPFVFNVPVGFRYPAGSPPHMKAALAWLPREAQETALDHWMPVQYTRATITDRAEMLRELAAIRSRGYARSDGEFTEGFTTLVMPIFNRVGEPFLVLQCAGVTQTLKPRESRLAKALRECVAEIHEKLGSRTPPSFRAGKRGGEPVASNVSGRPRPRLRPADHS
jgi:DNA-binding IclR family transcriptional regulator